MYMKPFSLEWLIFVKKKILSGISIVVKTLTGLFPLSMQDSAEANAVSLKVFGKTKKAIVIDGTRYTYPATINLHNYVTFNGTTYVKTPISSYSNKGKFDI